MKRVLETDWIASNPVFYNQATGWVSHNINDVIDFANFEFHPEGLRNYLEFGYSVFGQTPVRDVRFLPACARINAADNGQMKIESLDDPVKDWAGRNSHEDDVLDELCRTIREWEKDTKGELVVPLSGGYDSRLLVEMVHDRSRVRAFTYGLSCNQGESFEVVRAKKVAEILGIQWKQIKLGNYHNYIGDWDHLYGISTHSHGMYQMEFFDKIRAGGLTGRPMLSGLFGDIWAGNITYQKLSGPKDLVKIGNTHGMSADPACAFVRSDSRLKEEFWEEHGRDLQEGFYQTLWLIRIKIILISYLLRVPEYFGFKPWSPFLSTSVALGMLTLPQERRKDRLWQREYFESRHINVEQMGLAESRSNTLNRQAMRQSPLPPLDEGLLSQVIKPAYIAWINKEIACRRYPHYLMVRLLDVARTSRLLRRLGFSRTGMEAYFAYLTIKPIELLLRKRDAAQ